MASIANLLRLPITKNIGRSIKRFVSTSSKKNETAAVEACKTEAKTASKVWVHYGFEPRNKAEDRFFTHAITFCSITLLMVGSAFYYAYGPDYLLHDWARREAFLELRRRETNGLPLIDPNIVPIDQISLPSDEELGDTEIII